MKSTNLKTGPLQVRGVADASCHGNTALKAPGPAVKASTEVE